MAKETKVMIVDDDMTLHEMYVERLAAEGYQIISAYDGEEALVKIFAEMPDVILLDIMMPKVNGIDVMKRIRSEEKTEKIPVILLTALIQEINKIKEMMKEGDSYLVKSEIMPADVVTAIESALAKVK